MISLGITIHLRQVYLASLISLIYLYDSESNQLADSAGNLLTVSE